MPLNEFLVILNEEPGEVEPIKFYCEAEDTDHAAEQAENAYPGCEVLLVTQEQAVK